MKTRPRKWSSCTPFQVVYILEQVRALEQELKRRLLEQGLVEVIPFLVSAGARFAFVTNPCVLPCVLFCLPIQVVYILDQVRALEQELRRRLHEQGLPEVIPKVIVVTRLIPEARGNTCNQRIERIHGTEFAYILRIPFRDNDGKVCV